MKINRNNYEEYFILYMDNELSESDRRMVESFIAINPDLKEELDLLLQYKLSPDTDIIFEGKTELFKGESILDSSLQETLLNYLDNELTEDEKINTEKVLRQNSAVQKEFELLQKTKLQTEAIEFSHKESLYRTEKTYRIGVRWWRVAAAAVLLIGVGITTLIIINNNNKPATPEIVKTTPDKPVNTPVVKETLPAIEDNSKVQPIERNLVQIQDNRTPVAGITNKKENKTIGTPKKDIPENVEKKLDIAVNKKPSNDLPDITPENPYVNKPTNDATASLQPKKDIPVNESLTNPDVTSKIDNPYIKYAATQEHEVMEQPEKKNKLRGLFRKVARTFEKRTDIETTDNDNKLLVAGLAIKLK